MTDPAAPGAPWSPTDPPSATPVPAVAADLVTSDYRGDHATDVRVALAVTRETTVGDLLDRAAAHSRFREAALQPVDHIELRLVQP